MRGRIGGEESGLRSTKIKMDPQNGATNGLMTSKEEWRKERWKDLSPNGGGVVDKDQRKGEEWRKTRRKK